MIELRPDYQLPAYERARELRRAGHRRILLQMPTGAGKTDLAAFMVQQACGKGARAHFLVHRRELVRQTVLALDRAGIAAGIVAAGFPEDRNSPVQVCSIPSLTKRIHRISIPDLVIFDECFVAGTPVDGVPIEQVPVGMVVRSFDTENNTFCRKPVLRVFKRVPTALMRVQIGSRTIICTPNHKFWTTDGWVAASDLTENHRAVIRVRNDVNFPGTSFIRWHSIRSTEVLQSTSDGTFGGACPDGFVYNLEVADTHTYTVDGLVVSNCHHAPAKTWASLLQYYSDHGATILGLSATPWRLNGQGLRPWFDEMIVGPSTSDLIEKGWLSKYRLFTPGRLNMDGVHIVAGDYDKAELNERMKSSTVVGDCLTHYQKYVPGKRSLIFTWSIESSIDIARRFNEAGVPAAHIDGTTDPAVRDRAIKMFERGEILALTNVNIAIEGLNIPAVESLHLLRPTASLVLFLQAIGRALRPHPGKEVAYIWDHANNVTRFGLPCEPRDWTLDGEPKEHKKAKRDARASIRICPNCSATFPLTVRICENCQTVMVQSREIDVADGDLKELGPDEIRRLRRREQGKAGDLEALIRIGRQRGHKYPELWAKHVIRAREEKRQARAMRQSLEWAETPGPSPSTDEELWLF